MKNIFFGFVLTLFLNSFYCQNINGNSHNHSNNLCIGLNMGDVLRTSGPNDYKKSFNLIEINTRYMINNRVGIKFDAAFDKFDFSRSKTSLTRISIQPVISLTELVELNQVNANFDVIIHFGGGYSILKNRDEKGSPGDNMLNAILGFTPSYKISDRFSVNVDGSLIFNIMENKGFDWSSNPANYYASLTLGLSYSLIKQSKSENLRFDIKRNTASIDSLKNHMKILENSKEEMKTQIVNLNLINSDLNNKINLLENKVSEDIKKIQLFQNSVDSLLISKNTNEKIIPTNGYYVVVGSHKILNNAEIMKNKFISNRYRDTKIVVGLTYNYVSIFYSRNKVEAQSQLNKVLILEPKAWIFEIK